MREHAASVRADAVTGVRFDANDIADGITEVPCYGTAVRLASARDEYRLDELRGLAKGILCDGEVSAAEAIELREWLVSDSQ
jgi:hypothetical protein